MLRFVAGAIALILADVCLADENPPLLLRHPTVSATQMVFVYGGDLWSVAKEGGTAERLTATNGAASRPVNYCTTRDGEDMTTPVSLILAPKAMLINEYAGSGGDAMPWHFRQAKIGTLVGKRTWGGLVGFHGPFEILMDGGVVTTPSRGFWTPNNKWKWRTRESLQMLRSDTSPKPFARAATPNWSEPSKSFLQI